MNKIDVLNIIKELKNDYKNRNEWEKISLFEGKIKSRKYNGILTLYQFNPTYSTKLIEKLLTQAKLPSQNIIKFATEEIIKARDEIIDKEKSTQNPNAPFLAKIKDLVSSLEIAKISY